MASSCSESERVEQVISELSRGRDIADRIRVMLRQTGSGGSVQILVRQLLDTFNHSLTMLTHAAADSGEVSQAAKSEDSCKPRPPKDRRGCYKRKRSSETTIKMSSDLCEDGHAWRKYGQKAILNAKHPRSYFRCTHKFDQGCQASKQVQQIQDDPPLYRTTYNGQHTCEKSPLNHHHILPTPPDSSIIWSFNRPADSVKQEEVQIKSPPEDDYMSPFLDLSGDVYSCTASTHSIEDVVGSIEDFFEFQPLS
ncbi:WRKY DNA-binding transcription factor 70-like [Salvia hispanica]|uniref:WRKY DNA-binding transcription factor 70-like n=1 Tax=Salvia hispanica TaxID=49212 RepID=UPI002009AB66|nr:WRKY DNA-binding transcription factor 70-like [Salvia hispanica]